MAAITGRDLKLFQAMDAPDGTIALTYARAFDNFVWAYHCRIEGNRVIWADEPGAGGRMPRDEKITFEARVHSSASQNARQRNAPGSVRARQVSGAIGPPEHKYRKHPMQSRRM
jgi:hypothetical protein